MDLFESNRIKKNQLNESKVKQPGRNEFGHGKVRKGFSSQLYRYYIESCDSLRRTPPCLVCSWSHG